MAANPRTATVFFRNVTNTASANQSDQYGPRVVLSVTAP